MADDKLRVLEVSKPSGTPLMLSVILVSAGAAAGAVVMGLVHPAPNVMFLVGNIAIVMAGVFGIALGVFWWFARGPGMAFIMGKLKARDVVAVLRRDGRAKFRVVEDDTSGLYTFKGKTHVVTSGSSYNADGVQFSNVLEDVGATQNPAIAHYASKLEEMGVHNHQEAEALDMMTPEKTSFDIAGVLINFSSFCRFLKYNLSPSFIENKIQNRLALSRSFKLNMKWILYALLAAVIIVVVIVVISIIFQKPAVVPVPSGGGPQGVS